MKIYHEVDSASLASTLAYGIKKSSRGAKGDDNEIKETDIFLDKKIPATLKEKGVCRSAAIYGYIGLRNKIIDIKDGEWITLTKKQAHRGHALLKLEVDPDRCYVSNLDTYDMLLRAIKSNQSDLTLKRLAARYWNTLIPLSSFSIGAIERPEVMITYDIPTDKITIL